MYIYLFVRSDDNDDKRDGEHDLFYSVAPFDYVKTTAPVPFSNVSTRADDRKI